MRSHYCTDLDAQDIGKSVSLCGWANSYRDHGGVIFIDLRDRSGIIQLVCDPADSKSAHEIASKVRDEYVLRAKGKIRARGEGLVNPKLKTGEIEVIIDELIIENESAPLPFVIGDNSVGEDIRLKYRFLDLRNEDSLSKFQLRSKASIACRNALDRLGFLEVETPMMHPIAGGANARPFITHHNTLDVDFYLKIAPELYLKRLIVGGMNAIFEMNRCFRNEGMDLTHNPEFTSIEFYWAWHDYFEVMDLTEELFSFLIDSLNLPKILPYGELEIDFSKKFRRIKYLDALHEIGGIPKEIINDKSRILDKLKADGFEANSKLDLGHLQAELFDNYVESKLINPTFIIDFPISISPLSRRSDENPEIAERFELFIAGKELANAFNELNDPLDQYERFKAQIDAKNAGDDEAHEMDEDYCQALGYAMPPTAGWGLGVDRLVMLLLNKQSIRDVILFPAMRPKKD